MTPGSVCTWAPNRNSTTSSFLCFADRILVRLWVNDQIVAQLR